MGAVTTTEPVRRIVLSYSKTGPARYLGHLDLLRTFQRAVRRAGLPIAYSKGFNPHPRMMFASPLPVGAAGLGELAAMDLTEHTDPQALAGRLNSALPRGVFVNEAWLAPLARGTFGVEITSVWSVRVAAPEAVDWESALAGLLDAAELRVERSGGKVRDVRGRLLGLRVEGECGRKAVIEMVLLQKDELSAKPSDVVRALDKSVGPLRVVSLTRRVVMTDSVQSGGGRLRESPAANARDASRASDAKSRAKGGD